MLPVWPRPTIVQDSGRQDSPRSRLTQTPRVCGEEKGPDSARDRGSRYDPKKAEKLYCVPLKRAPVKEGGPEDEEEGLILQSMPGKDMQYLIEGKTIPWYQADVHWYIVGGQHMYQACVSIAKKEVPQSARHKFYSEFDVVLVYSRDPDMLIKVSNALNI